MKRITLLLLLSILLGQAYSHPWKPNHFVIVDTDAGLDDMRAISMLLASNDVKVLGIIVSGGALSPYDGYKKVKSMLKAYYHEGTPIAMNYNIRGHDMQLPLSLSWGEEDELSVPETNGFNNLCKELCNSVDDKITFVALGSLNSISELINGNVVPSEKIKEIIWSNNNLNRLNGFNAALDTRSANRIVRGDIPLVTVAYPSGTFYSAAFISQIKSINNRYSNKISDVIESNPDLSTHSFALSAADEMVPVYLMAPGLFSSSDIKDHSLMRPLNVADLRSSVISILKGGKDRGLQLLKTLPRDTSYYQADIQAFINEIIESHGREEWVSGVLANEIHRHLGIYSIVGVKMGIRAREYFGAGIDEIEIISSAGKVPPLSCMNDGLQVSTGATIGHGLLTVDTASKEASAVFKHMGRSIRISLKNDIYLEIAGELKELSTVNGLDSDIYWELVRQRAILKWKNLDRHKMFDIEIIDQSAL
jgi:pyrimidine-specific ribonucleoside hydrolase